MTDNMHPLPQFTADFLLLQPCKFISHTPGLSLIKQKIKQSTNQLRLIQQIILCTNNAITVTSVNLQQQWQQ